MTGLITGATDTDFPGATITFFIVIDLIARLTVIVATAFLFFPSFDMAVTLIVASLLGAAKTVTTPFAFTLAKFLSLTVQIKSVAVAFAPLCLEAISSCPRLIVAF